MKKLVTLVLAMATLCLLPNPPLPVVKGQATGVFHRARKPVPNQYIVVFRENVLPREIERLSRTLTRQHGGRIIAVYEHAPKGFAVEMPEAAARALSHNPKVAYVEENAVVTSSPEIGGDEPIIIDPPILPAANCFNAQDTYSWSIDRIDQRPIPREGTYCPNRTGRGVNVYVIDTGIWPSHEDFGGRARVAYDAFRPISDPNYGKDCDGHGTKAASIAGGNAKGVAREANLYGVQVFACNGFADTVSINKGIDWVTANHVKPAVANVSFTFQQIIPSVDEAVRRSIARGVTYAIGAGNDNTDAGSYSPARVAEAITVGASDITDKNVGAQNATEARAVFGDAGASNFGFVLDLFAPGAGGLGATTGFHNNSNSDYGDFGGTSMAAPMTAGVAAMYLEANPFASPGAVAAAIRDGATTGVLSEVGPGSPNRLLFANFVNAARDTFQFSAANYTANEGDGRLTVTVTRTGGNSHLAGSVEYTTTDNTAGVRCDGTGGMASDRCDYTTTLGVLRFEAGETSKTITVFLTDDSFVEGTETGRIELSMPVGADLGTQSSATLTVTDNDGAPSSFNPIDGNQFFVRMHYIDFLNREPEPGEPWTAVLDGCPTPYDSPSCDRILVSSAFFRSPEFEQKGFFVYRFYTASLGRRPLYLEFTRDSQRVTGSTGPEVDARRAAFANEWVQRPEFRSRYDGLSNDAYVDTLLQTAGVGNTITTDGVTYTRDQLVTALNAGSRTRAETLRLVVESDQEKSQEYNGAFVAMEYFGYLRREAEESGYQNWLSYLNANPQDYRTMVNGFIRSQEYRLRFGQP